MSQIFHHCFSRKLCRNSCWQVSSLGRVQSSRGRVSYGSRAPSGYNVVQIHKLSYGVHRLVAAAFLGPPPAPESWLVNHLDGDPSNNSVSNLEYVTPSENLRHAYQNARNRKPGLGKAVQWRVFGDSCWSLCPSQTDAATRLGVSPESVRKCCIGLADSCYANGIRYEIKRAALAIALPRHEQEMWREASYPGEEGTIPNLMISSHGRIWTKSHSRLSYGTRTPDGYYVVNRIGRNFRVHRLVAASFLGQPAELKLQVNHKDLNPGNNRLQNLEYVTPSENILHALRVGHRKDCPGVAVQARRAEPQGPWLHFGSIKAAATSTGVTQHAIGRICRGLSNARKWEFRYMGTEPLPGEEWRPVLLHGARAPVK